MRSGRVSAPSTGFGPVADCELPASSEKPESLMFQGSRGRLALFLRAVLFLLVCTPLTAHAQILETSAPQAFLLDYQTGTVLLDKNADVPVPPASMSKLMTVYLAFEAIRDGYFDLDSELRVSEEAWKKGGSKMFVEVGTEVRLEDLLRGIIVQSGNDACIVIAEALGGTEDGFADLMNLRAKDLGLENSNFTNATGWPHPAHRMSLRDLATLTIRLLEDFPVYFSMFAETEFTYGGIKQKNRNPLLYRAIGADGMKTGYTEEAGYGLAATAKRGGRRIILVFNGMGSENERNSEAARLLEFAFLQYQNVRLVEADVPIASTRVWLGRSESVSLVHPNPLDVTLPRGPMRDQTIVTLRYSGPLWAPVVKGTEVATLVIENPLLQSREVPLFAGEDVLKLGFVGHLASSLGYLVWGDP